MLHQEVKKLGENLGDLSKTSFNFIYSSIWQNFTHKLCGLGFFLLLGIITVDSVYSHIPSK